MLSPGICTSLSFKNGAAMVCSTFLESEKLKPVGSIKRSHLTHPQSTGRKLQLSFVIPNVSSFQQYLPTVSKKISVVYNGLSSKPAETAIEKIQLHKSTEGKGNDTRELKDVIVRGGRVGNKERCFKD